ncbi:PTS transporter subunit IIC [Fusibacter sp. JL216-2]|uniref:PTS transporter subunit IIC n=1 Tax=Fusibacter sp. JL216-2 TaxID=3071453 RepID=UPI003D3400FA
MKSFNLREYLIKTLNGMALGLFGSLIIGLILKQIGDFTGLEHLITYGRVAQYMMGPAIGAAVAYSVGASPLGIFASVVAGAIGAGTLKQAETGAFVASIGEPMGSFVAALCAAEFSKVISGKTKVDIVLVPALTIVVGGMVGTFLSPWIAMVMKALGQLINTATVLHPIPMGIIVAMLMGMILTLPISSAALAISLGLSGLAAGASLIGCCAQMIGFAVISYRENGFGGLIAQGLGTSMLQVPNIIRNPLIWLPPTLASGIIGPLGTTIFKMESNSIGAGMGTSGLVGQFGTIAAMSESTPMTELLFKMGLLHFILPGILSLLIFEFMRKRGMIKTGDLKLHS